MKSGLVILIIGGVLLAAGLVIAGFSTFSVTKEILEGSTIINQTSLEPDLAFASVTKDLPAGQQLLLSLAGNPSDVPLQARITGPDGDTLALYNITKTPFTSPINNPVTTKMPGDHTLEVKNVGSQTVSISGALLNSPVGQQGGGMTSDNPQLSTLITYGIGIMAGIVLVIAGIVLLIIGAIKYVKGRKGAQEPKSTPQ